MRRLAEMCPGSWRTDKIVHHCLLRGTCKCTSIEGSRALVSDLIVQALLSTSPIFIANNKWTKFMPPILWWLCGFGFYGVVVEAMYRARSEVVDPTEQAAVAAIDLAGPDNEEAYKAKKLIRWRRCCEWLAQPSTSLHLAVAATVLQPAIILMGRSFKDSRMSTESSIIAYSCMVTSPAVRALTQLAHLLQNEDSAHWLPARSAENNNRRRAGWRARARPRLHSNISGWYGWVGFGCEAAPAASSSILHLHDPQHPSSGLSYIDTPTTMLLQCQQCCYSLSFVFAPF